MPTAQAGELVVLVSSDKKRFVVRLTPGEDFHSHRGVVHHDDLIGHDLGQEVRSHTNYRFLVLKPSFDELLMTVKRATQIVYPKDIGYILMKLSVAPGSRVIEAGAGSGALTCAFAIYVAPGGRLYSYEARADMLKLAQSNVARLGLDQAVTFQQRDVQAEGFDETDVDAVFLDMREPWLALSHAATALANGGFLGTLVPTVNQVVSMAYALERGPFRDVEIAEIMLRQYKTTAERIRPLDRMTAHTGFLLFARKITRASAGHAGPDGDEGPADGSLLNDALVDDPVIGPPPLDDDGATLAPESDGDGDWAE